MMKFRFYLLIFSLMLLPGCCNYTRYADWVQSHFPAGCVNKFCLRKPCFANIYDNFRTVTLIDVLWLNYYAAVEFVSLRSWRECLSENKQEQLLKDFCVDLKQKISFYVLMPKDDNDPLIDTANTKHAWYIQLCVDGKVFKPDDIKLVEIDPIYNYFFERQQYYEEFIKFRQPYLVTFNAFKNGRHILACQPNITLRIATAEHATDFSWPVQPEDMGNC